MPIKLKRHPKKSRLRLKYLCALDNVRLQPKLLSLGSVTLHRYTMQELENLLRGYDDLPLDSVQKEEFEELSCLIWAHYEEQAASMDAWRQKGASGSDWDWNRRIFLRATAISRNNRFEPFRKFVETLNLLKPSDGPVRVCRIIMRPVGDVQTSEQIDSRYIHAHSAFWDPGEECVRDVLHGCPLNKSDERRFSILEKQLYTKSSLNNTQLVAARHFYERADSVFVLGPEGFDCTDPLLAYDACMEALLVPEEVKGNTGDIFYRRFDSLIRGFCPDWINRANRGEIPHPDIFARRVFVLRSKTAHGVWPISQIADFITTKANTTPAT